jgi:hypothetical protein
MNKPSILVRARVSLVLIAAVTLVSACVVESATVVPPTELASAPTQAETLLATSSLSPGTTIEPLTSPSVGPTPTAFIVWLPPYGPLPPTTLPTQAPPAGPTPPPEVLVPVKTGDSPPTRLVVKALGIDLPVIKGNSKYPYCNVAQYMLGFVNPGQPGTTYLYGHARTGMFLPFLTRSKINDGASLIGMEVRLYTADKKMHLYRINIVKRHVRDFSLAYDLDPGQHRLIMQTSEGPNGTYPKLQIAAKPIGVYAATAAQALPTPHPKICG